MLTALRAKKCKKSEQNTIQVAVVIQPHHHWTVSHKSATPGTIRMGKHEERIVQPKKLSRFLISVAPSAGLVIMSSVP